MSFDDVIGAAQTAYRANEAWQEAGQPPLIRVGLNTFPDGGPMHILPYMLGLRDPYAGKPRDDTFEGQYNGAYAHGSYDAALRGLAVGALAGALGLYILQRLRR